MKIRVFREQNGALRILGVSVLGVQKYFLDILKPIIKYFINGFENILKLFYKSFIIYFINILNKFYK